jgi:hypothetical protein
MLREFSAICLDQILDDHLVRDIRCYHGFHAQCLDDWYSRGHHQCPVCRDQLCLPVAAHLKVVTRHEEV